MLSEACATWAPVFVAGHQRVEGRPGTFVGALLKSGRARSFEGDAEAFDVIPLRETARVATEVTQRLAS